MKKTRTEKKIKRSQMSFLASEGGKNEEEKNKKNVQSFRLPNINSKKNNVSMATTECTMDTGGKTMSCEEDEALVVSGMNNRWFHRVKPASFFPLKNERELPVGSGLGPLLCCVSAVCWGSIEPASIIRTMAHGNQGTE